MAPPLTVDQKKLVRGDPRTHESIAAPATVEGRRWPRCAGSTSEGEQTDHGQTGPAERGAIGNRADGPRGHRAV